MNSEGMGGGISRRLLALGATAVMIVSACGNTATPATGSPAASIAPTSAASAVPSAVPSAAPSDAGYTGPEATISYSIWGDPAEIKSQQAVVDAFHAANPKITVKPTKKEQGEMEVVAG